MLLFSTDWDNTICIIVWGLYLSHCCNWWWLLRQDGMAAKLGSKKIITIIILNLKLCKMSLKCIFLSDNFWPGVYLTPQTHWYIPIYLGLMVETWASLGLDDATSSINSHPFKVSIPCEKPWFGLFSEQVLGLVCQLQLWSDAHPDTTNHPDGIRTQDLLTMSHKSHGCPYNFFNILLYFEPV